MRKSLNIIILLLLPVLAVAQRDTVFQHIKTIKGDIVDFAVDNLDNVYFFNSRNQLKKVDAKGDSVAIFNDVRKYGKASLIDVSNPLKVLLYYRDFATVVELDRLLNVRNMIDLRKNNIFQVKAICQSYDNKIWLYDELENKLKKINEEGKLLQETPDFRLLMDVTVSPVNIFDENKYVYLYDPVYGVNVFDYYGSLKNNIMIQGWQNFKVVEKYIYGSKSDTLYRYEINSFLYDEWKMPEQISGSRKFSFTSSRIYALKNDAIEIYSLR